MGEEQQDAVVVYQRIHRLIGHWKIEDRLKKNFTLLALGSFLLMCLALSNVTELAPADAGVKPVLWIVLAWVVFMVILSVAVIRMEARQKERLDSN